MNSFIPRKTWIGLFALTCGLFACSEDEGGSTGPAVQEKTCAELGSELDKSKPAGIAKAFKVVKPNGGESFKVGDRLKIRVISSENEKNALIKIRIVTPDGIESVVWPAQTGSLNLHTACDFAIAIPDSLTAATGGKKFSVVSNDVKIRVEDYHQGSLYFDLSDAAFGIMAK
jgi:hypothetical protein